MGYCGIGETRIKESESCTKAVKYTENAVTVPAVSIITKRVHPCVAVKKETRSNMAQEALQRCIKTHMVVTKSRKESPYSWVGVYSRALVA